MAWLFGIMIMKKVRRRVMNWTGTSVWGRGWIGRLRSGVELKMGKIVPVGC